MKKLYTCLLLAFAISMIKPYAITAQVNINDSLGLVALYNSTDGPHWKNHANWLTAQPANTWFGVTVINNRIAELRLGYNQLKGHIASKLGNLTALHYLYLNNNTLSGNIPTEFGKLTLLNVLSLANNSLSGIIPTQIFNIVSLDSLFLNRNSFNTTIPEQIGNLKNIKYLDLSGNSFYGAIPVQLTKLPNLTNLNLEFNALTGIPSAIGNLKTLLYLDLSYNRFSGNIPFELGRLSNLKTLSLNSNGFSGSIPPQLSDLSQLTMLNLEFNLLSGNIPIKLGNLNNLQELYLNNNQLSGSIPPEISFDTSLIVLNLSFNQLSKQIPAELGNLHNLTTLILGINQLGGKIPASLKNLTKLKNINLRYNFLKDTVPEFLTTLPNIKIVDITKNNFTFDGMQNFVQHPIYSAQYSPQRNIEIHQQNGKLSVYAGGILSRNLYRWFNNGILVAKIKGDSTFTPTEAGNYYVDVDNGLVKYLTLKSYTISVTALQNASNISSTQSVNKNDFSVYPNPAKTTATIVFNMIGNYTLQLKDVNGNILQTKTGVAEKGTTTVQLNTNNYAAGIYFITLGDAKHQTKKLQLNKQ